MEGLGKNNEEEIRISYKKAKADDVEQKDSFVSDLAMNTTTKATKSSPPQWTEMEAILINGISYLHRYICIDENKFKDVKEGDERSSSSSSKAELLVIQTLLDELSHKLPKGETSFLSLLSQIQKLKSQYNHIQIEATCLSQELQILKISSENLENQNQHLKKFAKSYLHQNTILKAQIQEKDDEILYLKQMLDKSRLELQIKDRLNKEMVFESQLNHHEQVLTAFVDEVGSLKPTLNVDNFKDEMNINATMQMTNTGAGAAKAEEVKTVSPVMSKSPNKKKIWTIPMDKIIVDLNDDEKSTISSLLMEEDLNAQTTITPTKRNNNNHNNNNRNERFADAPLLRDFNSSNKNNNVMPYSMSRTSSNLSSSHSHPIHTPIKLRGGYHPPSNNNIGIMNKRSMIKQNHSLPVVPLTPPSTPSSPILLLRDFNSSTSTPQRNNNKKSFAFKKPVPLIQTSSTITTTTAVDSFRMIRDFNGNITPPESPSVDQCVSNQYNHQNRRGVNNNTATTTTTPLSEIGKKLRNIISTQNTTCME